MSTQIQTLPQEQVNSLYGKYTPQLTGAAPLVVTDEQTYQEGSMLLSLVQQIKNKIDADYEALYRPIKNNIDLLAADFKDRKDKINLAKAIVQKGLQDYTDQKARELREEQQRILASAAPTEVKHAEVAALYTAPAPTNQRRELKLFITDLNAIPRDWFVLDEAKLKKFLSNGGTVPGAYVDYTQKVVAK